MFANKTKVNDKTKEKSKLIPCSLSKGQHAVWHCVVFEKKTVTKRAKYSFALLVNRVTIGFGSAQRPESVQN